MEAFFAYRWQKDKNIAISTAEDQELLEQLPKLIQKQIYTEFLFKDFVRAFKNFFNGKDLSASTYK